MKDLFNMTRHARRGTVTMLIAISLALLAVVAARLYREPLPEAAVRQEITRLDEAADTLAATPIKPERQDRSRQRSWQQQRRHPAKSKPTGEPRPLEPVPGF